MSERKQMKDDGQESRSRTGIRGLDDVLSGGLPTSHVFLVEGEPGTGKTTVGLQFLLEGARQGERVLYITLSESEREIRTVARSHRWALDGVSIFEFTAQEDSLRPDDQYSAFHPSEIELQDTTKGILDYVESVQPQRVVLDSLSEIRLLARDSLRYRRQVLALKSFFANRNTTVMLLDDLTGGPDDYQLRSIAHGVLSMEIVPRDFGVIRRRLRVAKLRGSRFREGYHDYTIERGGVVVYPRLVASEYQEDPPARYIPSGIDALDALWGNGIEAGSSTLLIGPAGVGKTSLSMVYATRVATAGDAAHVFVSDERVGTTLRRSARLGLAAEHLYSEGRLKIDQIEPAELSPGEFIQKIRTSVEQDGTKLVVLDSLNGLLAAMPGEEYLILHMHELLSYLAEKGVTTILVLSQAGILGTSMASPVDLSYLADNMLLFRYFEAGGQVRKAISVVKKRSGEHETTIREMRFSNRGLIIGEPLDAFNGVLSGIPSYTGPALALKDTPRENREP
jgi:circadian clock protein KaiC